MYVPLIVRFLRWLGIIPTPAPAPFPPIPQPDPIVVPPVPLPDPIPSPEPDPVPDPRPDVPPIVPPAPEPIPVHGPGFLAGDLVRCVDASQTKGNIIKGVVYKVLDVNDHGNIRINNYTQNYYIAHRFVLVC
jgi:hypothetical protein